MSSVQTVYIQYTQLKRAVNPPRKKKKRRRGKRTRRAAQQKSGRRLPPALAGLPCRAAGYDRFSPAAVPYSRAARVCLRAAMGANQRAAPPGMLILVCRPRACGFAPAPSRTLQAQALPPARLRVRPSASETVRTRCPAARALAGLPRRPVCLFWSAARARSRAPPPGMFASALPPARLRVCRAARVCLRAAMGANQRAAPPGMLILVCRPRSQPRSAARNVCFSPAAHACGFAAPPDMLISAPPRRRAARESTPARGR